MNFAYLIIKGLHRKVCLNVTENYFLLLIASLPFHSFSLYALIILQLQDFELIGNYQR